MRRSGDASSNYRFDPKEHAHGSEHAVFWLEAALIGLFGGFWVVETIELWNSAAREIRGS